MHANTALRILLVEPNDDFRFIFATLLELVGHTVETAETGTQALASISASPPDAVITELLLEDIGGMELAKQVRSLPSAQGVALIALSGFGQQGIEADALRAGFDCFTAKPVNVQRIIAVLETATEMRGCQPKH